MSIHHISSLESRYLDNCKKHQVLPNSAVLSWFCKAKLQKSLHGKCSLAVFLDQLKDEDLSPLIDVFQSADSFNIDVVDILHKSPCILNEEYFMSLMRVIGMKLRVVDLQDVSLTKDFLRDLSKGGLTCQILNLMSPHIRMLNMSGSFMRLHTLNLDFCTSLTSLQKDCFSCMPYLMRLSMCETRVANLWTTSAALSKLPSLVELRFQNCLCCENTGACPASSYKELNLLICDQNGSGLVKCSYSNSPLTDKGDIASKASITVETDRNLCSLDDSCMTEDTQSKNDDSSYDTQVKFSSQICPSTSLELSSHVRPFMDEDAIFQNEVSISKLWICGEDESLDVNSTDPSITLKKYVSHHPSPICFEKHYREYMIAKLLRLEVLDNLSIRKVDREAAKTIFSEYYEYLPYKRHHIESVVSVLKKREIGTDGLHFHKSSKLKHPYNCSNSQYYFSRSLSAAKLGSSTWPLLHPVSNFNCVSTEENRRLRPRQFEYHPSSSRLMVIGTLDGEVVVINHENGKVVGYIPSTGATSSVLGLCWLKKYPSKILAGSDDGSLKLYDINLMLPKATDTYCSFNAAIYDNFEQLTSVHANSTDDQFLASGYSKNVALYDISSGRRLQLFTDIHREPINVAKFSHHSPFMFATSSFDRDIKTWDLRQKPLWPCYTASSSRGNVMVCFSPDDHYLLVSAVDNEVKQLLAVDGRLHMNLNIASTGSAHNYTRSYYMNGRDYIISGSCDEHVVRICCAQTGKRLRDVCLEDRNLGNSMFVQSLRGDPFRQFHMSVLAAYMSPKSKWEIIKVNMLSSSHSAKEDSVGEHFRSSYNLGG